MNRDRSLEKRHRKSSNLSVWHIIGGAALAVVAYGVIKSIPDIQRYLKIRAM